MEISASLVTYKNNPEILRQSIKSFFDTPIQTQLSVVDNSPSPELSNLCQEFNDYDIDYYFNQGNNVGFSVAQNLAIKRTKSYDYHLVLNPDVYFDSQVIIELINYLENNPEIGLIQPKIYFPNGDLQYLCKRYPSIFHLFARRFIPQSLKPLFKESLDYYEMRDSQYCQIMDVPYLSGCFMLFRRKYLDEIGYFDENIFMYLEDADITVRMSEKYRSVFYPHVHIYHHWEKGAYKSLRLTWVTIQSAYYFFNKHGWKVF